MKNVLIEGVSFAVSDDAKKIEVFETNPDYVVGQQVTGRVYRVNGAHGVFVDYGVHVVMKDDLANIRPLGHAEVKVKVEKITPTVETMEGEPGPGVQLGKGTSPAQPVKVVAPKKVVKK